MKKLISLMICASLLLLASCGSESGDASKEVSKPESSAQSGTEASADESVSEEISEDFSEEVSEDRTIDRTQSKKLVSEGCSYTAAGTPHSTYADDGTHLTDGKFGGDVGYGWSTSRGQFVLDLGEKISGLADFTIMLSADNWGIVAPDTAVYSVSDDKKNWTEIGKVTGDGVVKEPAWDVWNTYTYPLELEESVSGRYVKIVLTGNNMNFAWAHEIGVWTYEKLEEKEKHVFEGTEEFSNLTFKNVTADSMGDQDAPGYCVYSKKGYNKGEFVFELSEVDVNTFGTKGGHVSAYVFLGINVYDANGYWQNCCDAGFTYDNETSGWHLFCAAATNENGERGWNADAKTLNPKHDYMLVLDSSEKDGHAVVYAVDLYDNTVADKLEFDLWGSKKDGSNTSYLTDIAIDWAGDATFVDTNGNPTTIENWVEITKANMGQGIRLNNVRLYGCALYKNGERSLWMKSMTDHRGIWSDSTHPIKEETTKIHHVTEDHEYIIDLDLG